MKTLEQQDLISLRGREPIHKGLWEPNFSQSEVQMKISDWHQVGEERCRCVDEP